jgi:hypothetical protein
MENVSEWKEKINSLNGENEIRIAYLKRICAENRSGNPLNDETGEDENLSFIPKLSLSLHLDPNMTSIFCSWGILLLRLMIEKSYSMIYQPLVRGPSGVLPEESLPE